MDRRTVQISPALNFNLRNCIHTKNVFSLVDLSPEDESYHKIKKHTDECEICSFELKKFELQTLESKIYIPKPQIDDETKEIFKREVSELFKAFNLNEKELLKKKIKNKIKKIDRLGADFLKNLTSKNMLKSYAFGAVLFLVLRQFFN